MIELIVDFRPGTTEDDARAVVSRCGGSTRRRMRSDDPALVRLLVKVEDASIARDPAVARVEKNEPNYGVS